MPRPYDIDDDDDPGTRKDKEYASTTHALKPHPGVRAQQHKNKAHERSTRAELAARGLLDVAEGGWPQRVHELQDYDLLSIPHAVGSVKYEERRIEYTRYNAKNAMKRQRWFFQDLTALFNLLHQCCEKTNPALFEDMYERCRMDTKGVPGGVMDGKLAWDLYLESIRPPDRTKDDRDFYTCVLQQALACHETMEASVGP